METIIFDPNVESLHKIVASTSKITASDLSDDVQLALVHDTRLSLRDARVRIEKKGKELRADALKFQKDVIAKEKELLAIITPEEDRLKAIEDEANTIKERAARAALLPMRKEQLAPLMGVSMVDGDDAWILDMDNDEFVAFLIKFQGEKNERDRLEIEVEKKRLADEAILAQVKKDAEVAERLRIEASQKLDEQRRIEAEAQKKRDAEVAAQKLVDDAKEEAIRVAEHARVEREKKEAAAQKLIDDAKVEADRVLREAGEKIEKEKALKVAVDLADRIEKEKREADKRYQDWLTSLQWKKEEDHLWVFETTADSVAAYKLVDTFKK